MSAQQGRAEPRLQSSLRPTSGGANGRGSSFSDTRRSVSRIPQPLSLPRVKPPEGLEAFRHERLLYAAVLQKVEGGQGHRRIGTADRVVLIVDCYLVVCDRDANISNVLPLEEMSPDVVAQSSILNPPGKEYLRATHQVLLSSEQNGAFLLQSNDQRGPLEKLLYVLSRIFHEVLHTPLQVIEAGESVDLSDQARIQPPTVIKRKFGPDWKPCRILKKAPGSSSATLPSAEAHRGGETRSWLGAGGGGGGSGGGGFPSRQAGGGGGGDGPGPYRIRGVEELRSVYEDSEGGQGSRLKHHPSRTVVTEKERFVRRGGGGSNLDSPPAKGGGDTDRETGGSNSVGDASSEEHEVVEIVKTTTTVRKKRRDGAGGGVPAAGGTPGSTPLQSRGLPDTASSSSPAHSESSDGITPRWVREEFWKTFDDTYRQEVKARGGAAAASRKGLPRESDRSGQQQQQQQEVRPASPTGGAALDRSGRAVSEVSSAEHTAFSPQNTSKPLSGSGSSSRRTLMSSPDQDRTRELKQQYLETAERAKSKADRLAEDIEKARLRLERQPSSRSSADTPRGGGVGVAKGGQLRHAGGGGSGGGQHQHQSPSRPAYLYQQQQQPSLQQEQQHHPVPVMPQPHSPEHDVTPWKAFVNDWSSTSAWAWDGGIDTAAQGNRNHYRH